MKSFTNFVLLVFGFALVLSCTNVDNDKMNQGVKIAMREVGNQLLLRQNDSASLIFPVKNIDHSKYRLSFENDLSFKPDELVTVVLNNFESTALPKYYHVEVIQCKDNEVAYSYQMSNDEERTIIPCSSRKLPKGCYYIDVIFMDRPSSKMSSPMMLYTFGLITIGFVFFGIYRNKIQNQIKVNNDFVKLGSFKFYKSQNILIKEAEEIALSRKEGELLAIFVARPNETITREELTKRVWEDNGVIVGRSLDTFISKLRKKLQDDKSIKLTNVHGVGYKLELL